MTAARYWQHDNPIECPKGHKMIWLGSVYWICPKCKKKTIWVLTQEAALTRPKRIQRKRTKGWRMPEGVVYVGRPTKWGNPFSIDGLNKTRAQAIEDFRCHVLYRIANGLDYPVEQLRGKDLACWCPLVDRNGNPVPCHADVLLEIANS